MKNIFSLVVFMALFQLGFSQVNCEKTKNHGQGFSTTITSVTDNCDGSYNISLRVEHNGCSGSKCKDLSNYAVQAIAGTYSNVSVNITSGSMQYSQVDLGPNLGSQIPFSGFKIDGISGLGNGKAGTFTISYTLNGGLQSQQVSAKPGQNVLIQNFSSQAFDSVLTCVGSLCGNNSPTSPALDFNVFVDEDAHLTTNETEGPVAVCRDLYVKGNYQIATHHAGNFEVNGVKTSFVVGNSVKFISGNSLQINNQGYVKIGNCGVSKVWYTDPNNAFSPIRITKNNHYQSTPNIQLQANAQQLGVGLSNNHVCQSNVIDFPRAFIQLKNNSQNLSLCNHNAQLTNANGKVINQTNLPNQVKINLQQGKNVLNISGTDLNKVSVFTYNQKPNANRYLIINVDAPGTFNWNVWNQAGIGFTEASYIIYNFYNTQNLNIQGSSTIIGSILAPLTHINKTVNQSNIEGQVIAKSFNHSGGEVHYAIFKPAEQGCGGNPMPTTSSFTPNVTEICQENNQIVFTNNSTGHGPLTYLWDFGDGNFSNQISPVHTFSNSGSYKVKLTVSALGGSDTSMKLIIIHPQPDATFTINDTIQNLTGNNFVFTPNQLNNLNSLLWDFGDLTTSHLLFPTKNYAQVGAYNVSLTLENRYGCVSNFSVLASVVSDSSSSGNDGGVESKSLEGVISQINYEQRMGHASKFDVKNAPQFKHEQNSVSRASGSRLNKFLPTQLNHLNGFVSTPLHLLGITNAVEVVAVDYAANHKTEATILATVTEAEPYNHTKYTCDRFLQGEITHLSEKIIDGIPVILFVIEQPNGIVEYGIEFSAGFNQNQNSFDMQTGWLIHQYAERDTMYNFQVWANSPQHTLNLVNEIFNNLNGHKPLVDSLPYLFPEVYITKGKREEGKLNLTIKNNTPHPYLNIKWCEKHNEQTTFDTLFTDVLTFEDSIGTFVFEVGDKYEFDLYFNLNNQTTDKVYMADANWGLDFVSDYTSVKNYQISNAMQQINFNEKYPLYRNVNLQARTADYITLFKDLTAGGLPTDLNDFIGLSFYAQGEGKVKLRLFDENIQHWRAQYYTFIELTENLTLYQISFDDFVSDSSTNAINLSDLTMLSFTYVSESFEYEDFEITLENTAFVKQFEVIGNTADDSEKDALFQVYPNPAKANAPIQMNYFAEQGGNCFVELTDISGKIIQVNQFTVQPGNNLFKLNISESKLTKGSYVVKIRQNSISFSTPLVVE